MCHLGNVVRGRLRSKLMLVLPAALILLALAGFTLISLGGSGDRGGEDGPGIGPGLDPHPAAGSFVADGAELEQCDEQACYEQAFGNLVFERGPERAFARFDAAIAEEGPIESGCHRIAHRMGAAGLARYEDSVGEAFAHGSASCWSGYYHGILEASLGADPREQLGADARRLCDDVRDGSTTFLIYQCVHGLGHGLMITTGYGLPDALNACGEQRTEWDQASCRGGVFMENVATAAGSPIEVTGDPDWLDDDDLLYPCTDDEVVPAEAKQQCYIMATSRVLEANGYSFEGAARWCRRAQREWVETCFQSLGRDSSGSSTYDPRQTLHRCRAAREYLDQCLWGAARDYTARFAGGKQAAEFCGLASPRLRPGCFHAIGTIVATLHDGRAQRMRICRSLSGRYARECARGTVTPSQPIAPRR